MKYLRIRNISIHLNFYQNRFINECARKIKNPWVSEFHSFTVFFWDVEELTFLKICRRKSWPYVTFSDLWGHTPFHEKFALHKNSISTEECAGFFPRRAHFLLWIYGGQNCAQMFNVLGHNRQEVENMPLRLTRLYISYYRRLAILYPLAYIIIFFRHKFLSFMKCFQIFINVNLPFFRTKKF